MGILTVEDSKAVYHDAVMGGINHRFRNLAKDSYARDFAVHLMYGKPMRERGIPSKWLSKKQIIEVEAATREIVETRRYLLSLHKD